MQYTSVRSSIFGLPGRGKRRAATLLQKQSLGLLLLAFFTFLCLPAAAQKNEWTWMGGYNDFPYWVPSFTMGGHHGELGVPSAANIPGMREGAATWTDKSGNLWFFGGNGAGENNSFGYLNDLWKFNPATNLWAWMGGDATIENDCTSYSTSTGSGTACGAPGYYGEMGVADAANTPGGRAFAVTWTDASGNLWLFGGQGYEPGVGQGYFNDLWRFNPRTLEWAWMGGSPTVPGANAGPQGIYGMLGAADVGNVPGGRSNATGWADPSGNFWLYGGFGEDSLNSIHPLSDLWKYSPRSGQWTWVSGSKVYLNQGTYGQQGVPALGNVPGQRQNAALWADARGKIWVFGGEQYTCCTYFNDLWEFDPSTALWAWMGGSNTPGQPGLYGPVGQPGTGFRPSARGEMAQWVDASGEFWIFGGRGVDGSGNPYKYGDLNDLWTLDPITLRWTWMSGSQINNNGWFGVGGVYGTLGIPSVANTPGGREWAANWTDQSGNLWLFGGEGAGVNGDSWGVAPNDLWKYQVSGTLMPQAATPTFTPAGGAYTSAQQVSILDSLPNATIYYSTDATDANSVWTPYTGPVTVSASQTLSAVAMAPGYTTSQLANATYKLPAATPVFNLPSGSYNLATVKLSCATLGATIYYSTNGKAPTTASWMYNGQIVVKASETIEAMAVAKGSSNSAVAMAAYTIVPGAASTNEWTWVAGASVLGKTGGRTGSTPGVYGTKGKFAAGNLPGGRDQAVTWTDRNGSLWLFGGQGEDAKGSRGTMNDLWEWNPSSGQWAWMGGNSTFDGKNGFSGVYGTLGVFAAGNYPGSRYSATAWRGKDGNLWLFGGQGYDSKGNTSTLNDLWEFNPVKGQWAWMNGPSAISTGGSSGNTQQGRFGALGVSSPTNIPGARNEAAGWTDNNGNLWLFGGNGLDSANGGTLNDMWKFNPNNSQWTWMGGSATVGARGGQPGIYGEPGVPESGNIPGGRSLSTFWTDAAGHFWLFGGWGYDANEVYGTLNDLWEFNPATNEWTWISGTNALEANPNSPGVSGFVPGVYGTQGVPAAGNVPGGRQGSTGWLDKSGNLWLFGGSATDSASNGGYLNDIWEFSPATRLWTWMGGSSLSHVVDAIHDTGVQGAYGTLGVPAAGNAPGGRDNLVSWSDGAGNLWLMGGFGSDSTGALDALNDVWKFKPAPPAPPAATPVFSLASGYYGNAQIVKIGDATAGAKIYYTTNGLTPTIQSTLYTGPISVTRTTFIEAIAVAPGESQSGVAQATYIISQ